MVAPIKPNFNQNQVPPRGDASSASQRTRYSEAKDTHSSAARQEPPSQKFSIYDVWVLGPMCFYTSEIAKGVMEVVTGREID